MNPDLSSLALLAAASIIFILLLFSLRPGSRQIKASLTAGLIIAAANVGFEFFGALHDIYYVHGRWPFLHSALSLTAAWMLLAAAFALGTDRLKKSRSPRLDLAAYIIAGIIAGIFSDYAGQRWLGHFQLGAKGSWLLIFGVWAILTPSAIGLYKFFAKLFRG
jgi:hypothetical protein